MNIPTEQQLHDQHAEEICVIGYTAGAPDTVFLLDTANEPAQELNKKMARALAIRLLLLAEELPETLPLFPRTNESDPSAPREVVR